MEVRTVCVMLVQVLHDMLVLFFIIAYIRGVVLYCYVIDDDKDKAVA